MSTVFQSGKSGRGDEQSSPRLDGPRPLVLVAEDHEDTRCMLRLMLEVRGFSVVEAADGEQAVELAVEACPDLILMDGSLPRLDGLATTRRLRERPATARVPIIFISGHAEPAFCMAAREAGCDEFLTKPLEVDRLDEVLAKYAAMSVLAEV